MVLHEAIKHARQDLRLSQKKLADMAGIQRRQLATLEAGGNVTLATLRKVLVHLPNLETFTLDTVTAMVQREVTADERQKAVNEAMELLASALQNLVGALKEGRLPDEALSGLRQVNDVLYQQALGYSAEDVERERQRIREEHALPELTQEQLAPLLEVADAEAAERLESQGLTKDPEEEGEEPKEPNG